MLKWPKNPPFDALCVVNIRPTSATAPHAYQPTTRKPTSIALTPAKTKTDEIQGGLRYALQTDSKYTLMVSGTGHAGELRAG
jgi:hypothetical protein